MDSPKWFIAIIFVFLFLTLVGNIVEGVGIFTAAQAAKIQGMTKIQTSQASDPTVGGVLSYGGTPKDTLDFFIKAVKMDFSWLWSIERSYTQAQCTTAGGRWNSTHGTCMVRNQWYWIWMLVYVPVMAGVLISLGLMIARLIRGV